jgi:hypothetical protein
MLTKRRVLAESSSTLVPVPLSFLPLPLPPRRSSRTLHHNAIESHTHLLAVCAVRRAPPAFGSCFLLACSSTRKFFAPPAGVSANVSAHRTLPSVPFSSTSVLTTRMPTDLSATCKRRACNRARYLSSTFLPVRTSLDTPISGSSAHTCAPPPSTVRPLMHCALLVHSHAVESLRSRFQSHPPVCARLLLVHYPHFVLCCSCFRR